MIACQQLYSGWVGGWVGANTGHDAFRITTPHFGSQTMATELVLIMDITALCGLVISHVSILLLF